MFIPLLRTRENQYRWCKSILVLISHWQIGGMYVMGLDSKHVGIVIICLRIDTTKVILAGGKWLMLLNAMVVQLLLYGVEVWGGTILLSARKRIEKIQKVFLCRQLGFKSSTSYFIMLVEICAWPSANHAKKYTSISQKSRIYMIIDCPSKLGTWDFILFYSTLSCLFQR